MVLSACGESNDAVAQASGPTDPGLPADLMGGTGRQGAVVGGRAVAFQDPIVAQYAREIAKDELDHVRFLRTALGTSAVAHPAALTSSRMSA